MKLEAIDYQISKFGKTNLLLHDVEFFSQFDNTHKHALLLAHVNIAIEAIRILFAESS